MDIGTPFSATVAVTVAVAVFVIGLLTVKGLGQRSGRNIGTPFSVTVAVAAIELLTVKGLGQQSGRNIGAPFSVAVTVLFFVTVTVPVAVIGLLPFLERYPRHLSGGQRQRVAMGRAIVRAPSVFLFDEPLSNLDAALRVRMRAEIRELHRRLETTVVYVTHDQIEAMTMADRIIVLDGGHVSQAGTPLELYDCPRNVFVAAFIGSPAMNLLPARTRADGGARLEDGQILAPRAEFGGVRDVVLGVRPEHLALAEAGGAGTLRVRVSVVEPTGSETLVSGRLGGGDVTAALRGRREVAPGDMLSFAPEEGHVHVFDAGTGLRIGS